MAVTLPPPYKTGGSPKLFVPAGQLAAVTCWGWQAGAFEAPSCGASCGSLWYRAGRLGTALQSLLATWLQLHQHSCRLGPSLLLQAFVQDCKRGEE